MINMLQNNDQLKYTGNDGQYYLVFNEFDLSQQFANPKPNPQLDNQLSPDQGQHPNRHHNKYHLNRQYNKLLTENDSEKVDNS